MQKKFLEFLVDPITSEPLTLIDPVMIDDEIETGLLQSASNSYPIVNGIPRFVPYENKNYAGSFGYQWNKWKKIQFESDNKGRPLEGYTTMMWERITDLENSGKVLEGKVVVDIGCGPGRFTDVALAKGAMVIGVDYSLAVEACRENFPNNKNLCIIQADALQLPIKSDSIDAAFSIGVLHHTPNPQKGVAEANRILSPGGWFAISVYEKGGYYDKFFVQLWRRIFNFLWPVFKQYPPLIYTHVVVTLCRPIIRFIPPLGKVIKQFYPFVNLPDKRWSILDTFDSITPSYQSAHESYEIYKWFVNNGYKNIRPTNWASTAYIGSK
jgi:ubiquinone/menaquinone biosynthesis C-methylase UbiE/uncharacterized protein YbaR (Trm112 family)